MKILLINNIFYRKGGSEAVFFNTARLLRESGHEVRFFSMKGEHNLDDPDGEFFAPESGGIARAIAYFYNRPAAKALDRMLESWKPDIAHIHLVWGGLSPSIIDVLHRHKVPVVHTAHDYRMVCPAYTFRDGKGLVCERCKRCYIHCAVRRCSKGSFARSLMMAAEMRFRNSFFNPAKTLDGIIYVSGFSRDRHIAHNPAFARCNGTVLYNFSKAIGNSRSEGFYLFSGRLSPEKGCRTLIEAFRKNPQCRLVIAGSGPEEASLRELASTAPNVSFTGHLDREELFDLLGRCSFVIVPSEWYENNPMSIIEAYAAGKPVVAARTGGIPEIVREGVTGLLFESGSAASLSEALRRSASSVEDGSYASLCSGAEEYFSGSFNESSYVVSLTEFYNKTIALWMDRS